MFKILALTLVAAVVTGFATGGRFGGLANLNLRWLPLVPVSLGLGLLPVFADTPSGLSRTLAALANVGVLAFLVANLTRSAGVIRAGFAILLAGWAFNAAAIVANGGMPLSLWAYRKAGLSGPISEGEGGFFKIVIAREGSLLKPLGDVIPVRAIGQVVSVGDLLLVAGIGVIVVGAMRMHRAGAAARSA